MSHSVIREYLRNKKELKTAKNQSDWGEFLRDLQWVVEWIKIMHFVCMNIPFDIATNCHLWWKAFFMLPLILFLSQAGSKVCYMLHINFSVLYTQMLSVSKLRINCKYIWSQTVAHNTYITHILTRELQVCEHCKLFIITVDCMYVYYINLKVGLKLSNALVYSRECELSD